MTMVPVMLLTGTQTIVGVGGYPAEDQALYDVVEMDDQTPAVQSYLNPPPPVLSARQFWTQLAVQGHIDEQEAVEALEGDLPNAIKHFINNTLPAPQRFAARMFFTDKQFLFRSRTPSDVKACFSIDDAAIDTFFRAAAQL
jgi:hypothetical protein